MYKPHVVHYPVKLAIIFRAFAAFAFMLPGSATANILDRDNAQITAVLLPECTIDFSQDKYELSKTNDDRFSGIFTNAINVRYNTIVDLLIKDISVNNDPAGGSLFSAEISSPAKTAIRSTSYSSSNQTIRLDPTFALRTEKLTLAAEIRPSAAVPGTYAATINLFCLNPADIIRR